MGWAGKWGNSFRVIHLLDDKLHEYLNYFLMVTYIPPTFGDVDSLYNSIYPRVTTNLWIKLETAEWFKTETPPDKADIQIWSDSLNFSNMFTTITSKDFSIKILYP